MSNRRTGRRRGNPDTREQILDAARHAFAERGFERATIRQIAQAAEVDPALVHHYFGSKDQLLLATIDAPFDPQEVLPGIVAGGIDGVGERLVRAFIAVWDGPGGKRGAVLLRSAVAQPLLVRLVREFFVSRVVKTALKELGSELDNGPFRATLVASQLLGLAMARYILKLEPLASAEPEAVVAMIGPTVQGYLTSPVPVEARGV
ncbi:TetR/AcrR family transcriptional regulator [Phytomonospora endophytica]|uniref:AcrR family transcriptional regulator n=1 Tax=Phytomonospora endophytica TaxID=714109 RepID=A0A841FCR9_9ACTN|nr:TetR family transcriptional regulator [Phytomonospora endophytica]MBB6032803.1 AcrR family transcriptional regulator [Phytomonospora endophytica]GIG66048.1 TetR family transcriptional regulator [Phytomonospora endophytica]